MTAGLPQGVRASCARVSGEAAGPLDRKGAHRPDARSAWWLYGTGPFLARLRRRPERPRPRSPLEAVGPFRPAGTGEDGRAVKFPQPCRAVPRGKCGLHCSHVGATECRPRAPVRRECRAASPPPSLAKSGFRLRNTDLARAMKQPHEYARRALVAVTGLSRRSSRRPCTRLRSSRSRGSSPPRSGSSPPKKAPTARSCPPPIGSRSPP